MKNTEHSQRVAALGLVTLEIIDVVHKLKYQNKMTTSKSKNLSNQNMINKIIIHELTNDYTSV